MKKPSLGWQSWSSPFKNSRKFPIWDYSPFDYRGLPKKIKSKKPLHVKYWCSWYAFGWNITQLKIEKSLRAIKNKKLPFTHILIDDGWTTWGDWHVPEKKKFSNFNKMITRIQSDKLKVGLWFAPFLASKSSQLFRDHPDWFVKFQGKPVQGLKIYPWTDRLLPQEYLLDFELKAVKRYITDFIDRAVIEWKIDLLKLDFLYAPYFNPRHATDKIPHEQVRWLFKYIHNKYPGVITIASGTPFAPVMNLASIVRASQDTALPPLVPIFINKLVYRARIKILSLKMSAMNIITNQNIDPDVRLFKLDNEYTEKFWGTINKNILGVGDDLLSLSNSEIIKLEKWLRGY